MRRVNARRSRTSSGRRTRHALSCVVLAYLVSTGGALASPAPRVHTEAGTLRGASYRMDGPARWNHKLVVYFHGYSDRPIVFGKGDAQSPLFDPLLERGYAEIGRASCRERV